MPVPREAYVLTDAEIEKLRGEMAVEAGWDMGFQLIDLIYEVRTVREEMDDYPLTLDLMKRVIHHFVRRGSFGHAARTLKAFRDLEQDSAALPERHRALLGQAVQRMRDAERIQEIGATLNRGLGSEMAEIETYLRLLPRRAVEPLLDLLGEVKQRKGRRILCEVLAELLGDNLDPLVKRLDDPRWFVVRNLVYILRRSGNQDGLTYLRRTLTHSYPKVRQETLRAMEAMGMARSPEFLLGLLGIGNQLVGRLRIGSGGESGNPSEGVEVCQTKVQRLAATHRQSRQGPVFAIGLDGIAGLDRRDDILDPLIEMRRRGGDLGRVVKGRHRQDAAGRLRRSTGCHQAFTIHGHLYP